MSLKFINKLTQAIGQNNSLLCLGLDPDPIKFPNHFPGIDQDPERCLIAWGREIIKKTSDLVCCYKPNFAFYEQFGPPGLAALRGTISLIPDNIPALLDAKRGDIGSTATAYARAAFEVWQADAITVNPYLGRDSLTPFLAYPDKAVFVLCYTSNPSASEIQTFGPVRGDLLFEHIVRQAQTWGDGEQVAFVVGATQAQALSRFRTVAPNRWILAPGIGAQGGNLAETVTAGLNSVGSGLIIPVSRSVIYADDARQAALTLRAEINQLRAKVVERAGGVVESTRSNLIFQLHEVGCIQFGAFTLASGRQSPLYIDLRRLSGYPGLLRQVAQAYAQRLAPLSFDRLAGIPYAALPIGTAVALEMNKPLIYPRKEIKSYGTGRTIEGVFEPGERTVIIEDIVTSGGSALQGIKPLVEAGLQVKDVVVLIDREQDGAKNLADQGYRLHAVFQLTEIFETLHQAGRISDEVFKAVQALPKS